MIRGRRNLLPFASALLLLGVAFLVGGRGTGPRPAATPADEVKSLLYDGLVAAMRKGKVNAYLNVFAAPLRARLQAEIERVGRRAFAAQLREHNARVTSVAVAKVEVAGETAAARLEWVYRDDSDVQQVRLVREGGRWRIAELTTVKRAKLPVPSGTEVVPGLGEGE